MISPRIVPGTDEGRTVCVMLHVLSISVVSLLSGSGVLFVFFMFRSTLSLDPLLRGETGKPTRDGRGYGVSKYNPV